MGRVNNATPIDKIEEGNASSRLLILALMVKLLSTRMERIAPSSLTVTLLLAAATSTPTGVELTDDGNGLFEGCSDRRILSSISKCWWHLGWRQWNVIHPTTRKRRRWKSNFRSYRGNDPLRLGLMGMTLAERFQPVVQHRQTFC